jgi:hypothetical protein
MKYLFILYQYPGITPGNFIILINTSLLDTVNKRPKQLPAILSYLYMAITYIFVLGFWRVEALNIMKDRFWKNLYRVI